MDEHPIPNKPGVIKQIVYFVAEYENQDIRCQKEELLSAQLMRYEQAMDSFQWENSKAILTEADHFLRG